MRLHEHFPILWPRYDPAFVRDMMQVEHLAAVRLEPVYSIRFEAFMDVLFERDGRWLVVPMTRIEGVSIMVPENPPVAWPSSYGPFASAATDAVEDEIVPWLRSITAGRLVNDEHVRFFKDSPAIVDAYEEARRRALMGATPYPDVLRSVGPSVYALRFAKDRTVALKGRDAANGAAVLSSVAARVDANVDAFERAWFGGLSIGSIDATQRYGAYVGPREEAVDADYRVCDVDASDDERSVALAEPIPTDVTISFDLEDAPEARRFAVSEVALPLRPTTLFEPARLGGSSGSVRLIVRDDAGRFTDADTDAAGALAVRLRAEGFDAEVTTAGKVDRERTDIIHVFGLRHGASLVELLRDAEQARIPVVVTPYADDRANEAVSGASGALLIPRVSSDTLTFYDFIDAFARRKIANLTDAPWYDDASSVLMQRAAAALVATPSEGEFLRTRFGYRGAVVPSALLVPLEMPDSRIGALVGPDEFVLIHAPIEPRNHQVFAALAAGRLDLPIVVMGPVADIEFFRYLNEWAGARLVQLRDHDLTPAEIAGVYARARVVADFGWSSRGLERLARGAAHGAALVATRNSYASEVFGSSVAIADPASLDSMTEALRAAWQHGAPDGAAAAAARIADPLGGLIAAVTAYQQASAPAVP